MIIKSADFIGSFVEVEKCPPDTIPEYAFIGRSNAGKSSLINMLCARKELAKVSQKPGKTQTINVFKVNKEWHLTDLPGYGYAKTPKTVRENFGSMIEQYLLNRATMQCAFVLIDANVTPQEIDIDFLDFLGENSVPFVLLFTKSDKSKPEEVSENIFAFQQKMLETWNALPRHIITSAEKNIGRDEILNFVKDINKQFYEHAKIEVNKRAPGKTKAQEEAEAHENTRAQVRKNKVGAKKPTGINRPKGNKTTDKNKDTRKKEVKKEEKGGYFAKNNKPDALKKTDTFDKKGAKPKAGSGNNKSDNNNDFKPAKAKSKTPRANNRANKPPK